MSFIPAAAVSQSVPTTRQYTIAEGYAGKKGALVLATAGAVAECGADPAQITGIAISDGGANTDGFSILPRHEFPPYTMQVYIPKDGELFRARYTGTLGTVGTRYGVIKDTDDLWKVDFSETVAARVVLRQILNVAPENVPEVIVDFLPDFITPLPV